MATTSETIGVPPEVDVEKVAEDPLAAEGDIIEYPSGRALTLIITALLLAIFLVALVGSMSKQARFISSHS